MLFQTFIEFFIEDTLESNQHWKQVNLMLQKKKTGFWINLFYVPHKKETLIGLEMMVSKWQNFHFWVNYPFKVGVKWKFTPYVF